MRINQFLAHATELSRRAADQAVSDGRVRINEQVASVGDRVEPGDNVQLDSRNISPPPKHTLVMLNKPVGYICSRNGQGNPTVYDLIPLKLHKLKPVGRLDKDSSGLLLLTDDGSLAHNLTHPKFHKEKVYEIELNKALAPHDQKAIIQGIVLDDGLSKLRLRPLSHQHTKWEVRMSEGRNRQIRRTFQAQGYRVLKLQRIQFGTYKLGHLDPTEWIFIDNVI